MKKSLIPLIILLVLAFVFSGCSSTNSSTPAVSSPPSGQNTGVSTPTEPSSTTTQIQTGGTLTIITNALVTGPIGIPQDCIGPTLQSQKYTYETPLIQLPNGQLGYKLAQSADYNMSADNSGITIHLKQGIKFSDGTDLNAQAMEWNLDQLQSYMLYGGTTNWNAWTVVDPYTVRITYKEWRNAMFTDMMEGDMGFMASPTAYEKNGKTWAQSNMVGTGPFMQKSFLKDQSLTMVKNPDYWQTGKPYLDGITLLYITDPLTGEAAMRSGEAQVLSGATPKQAYDLKQSGFKIIYRTEGTNALIPDSAHADSPWSNLQVREAAEYALDKASIAQTFGYGYWQPAYEMADPIETDEYDPNFPGRNYDVAKAKQLLADGGYPNGFKTTLIAQDGTDQNLMEAIQADLAKVGIQATLEFPQAGKFNDEMFNSGWDNGLLYSSFMSSYNMVNSLVFYFATAPLGSCFNNTLQRPADFNQSLINAMHAPLANPSIPAGNPTMLKGIVQTIFNNVMAIPVTYGAQISVTTDNVHGLGLYQQFRNWACTPEDAWLSK